MNEVRAKNGVFIYSAWHQYHHHHHPRRTRPKKGEIHFLVSIPYTLSAASLRLRSAPSYALHTHLTYARPRLSHAATRRWCSTSTSANVNSGGTSSSCTSKAVVSRTSGRSLAARDTRVARMSGRGIGGSRTFEDG